MRIAIASDKGGTGKTTVSVNLALSLENAQLLDCDVEEPNCNLFLNHPLQKVKDVGTQVPAISKDKCTSCGKCAEACRFNALAVLLTGVILFPKLCHGCGACSLVCPEGAISETIQVIGSIERSASYNHGIELYRGILNIGEPRASPVIRSLKEHIDDSRTVIIDSPPGTSCPVIASISGADLVFIVAEPSASAIHDLERVIKAAAHFRIKTVVCINRCDINKEKAAYIEDYCTNNGVKVIGKLPLSETPTKAMLEGRTVIEYKDDVFTGTVQDIWYRVYSELVS